MAGADRKALVVGREKTSSFLGDASCYFVVEGILEWMKDYPSYTGL